MGELALTEEVKRDNRIVTGWLLHYHERKREYLEKRHAVLESSPPRISETGPVTVGSTSDSTGSKAAKLADMAAWIDLIEDVQQRLPWKMQIFLRLRQEYRYARGRNGWTAAVQWKYAEEVAARLGKKPEDVGLCSRQTFSDWWNRLIEYTARLAGKKGLL